MIRFNEKVYFDASVIIAGLLSPTGGSSALLTLAQQNSIIGITSQTVVEEILSHRHKISKRLEEIIAYIQENNLIIRNEILLEDIQAISDLMIDVDDTHVFVGATHTGADYLVSLDKKHILAPSVQAKFPHLHICSPKELLAVLRKV
jgi:putative PIN family toxin of toxin-antitoxin system